MVGRSTEARELLALSGVTKVFPNGTQALRGVDLAAGSNSIRGLVGANGAGKSTLVKIMSGATAPSQGEIRWREQSRSWAKPAEALKAGIATVHQHPQLVPTLSVLENVCLAHPGGPIWHGGRELLNLYELFDAVEYELDPNALVGDLSIGDRQMVAILQAISQRPELLILDEPTASLSMSEREILHRVMRRLRDQGTGLVFVSHLLDEVMALTDSVTVLRDGRVVLDETTVEISHDELVRAIVGREIQRLEDANLKRVGTHATDVEPAMRVRGVSARAGARNISFDVALGEVVGLAGLLGSGRSEILHAVYGSDTRLAGSVTVHGRSVRCSPVAAVRAGMALVPEDRGQQGLIRDWEVWRNISLPGLARHSHWSIFPRRAEELERAELAVKELGIQPPSAYTLADELSGGNAQKTVFAKWLHEGVRVLLLDEPTAGIDIGAKRDIQLLIRNLTESGASVVVVDSEFRELLAMADRVLVVRRGRVVAERQSHMTSEGELLALASGLTTAEDRPNGY